MAKAERERVLSAGRVAFLALRGTITAELAQGWSIVSVFKRHEHRLGIGISQFRSYVRRYAASDLVWANRNKKRPNTASASHPTPAPATTLSTLLGQVHFQARRQSRERRINKVFLKFCSSSINRM